MNKQQFLWNLRRMLRRLPADELEKILAYYREMIEDKVESGQTEQEAVRGLGDIRLLAQKILAENPNRRPTNVGKIIAITAVSLFGVLLVSSIALACFSFRWIDTNGIKIKTNIQTSGYEYKKYQTNSKGVNTIDLTADDKAIEIEPTEDSGQITVDYATNQNQKYDFSCKDGRLTIINKEQHVLSGWSFDGDNTPRITIQIPKSYAGDIKVSTTNSYIQTKDLNNLKDLSCETSNSYIKITSVTAQTVKFQTENAAISLNSVIASSKMFAETQNAAITMSGIESPDISLHTQNALISGTIHGKEDDYSIDAQTTNAISNLNNRSGGNKKLEVETTNAIISVKFEG